MAVTDTQVALGPECPHSHTCLHPLFCPSVSVRPGRRPPVHLSATYTGQQERCLPLSSPSKPCHRQGSTCEHSNRGWVPLPWAPLLGQVLCHSAQQPFRAARVGSSVGSEGKWPSQAQAGGARAVPEPRAEPGPLSDPVRTDPPPWCPPSVHRQIPASARTPQHHV